MVLKFCRTMILNQIFDHIFHILLSCHVHLIMKVASLTITTFKSMYI
jgi:hypothetical protein